MGPWRIKAEGDTAAFIECEPVRCPPRRARPAAAEEFAHPSAIVVSAMEPAVGWRSASHCRAFLNILKRHWPALKKARLVTSSRPRVWRATDKRTGRTYFVETFAWKDSTASELAHRTPEVMAVWGPMEPLLESMDIAVVEPVDATP